MTKGVLNAPGINDVDVLEEERLGKSLVFDAFGFLPTLMAIFRLDKEDEQGEGENMVAEALNNLLAWIWGDAVLLLNNEVVVALRKDGVLTLNTSSSFWVPRRFARISFPYERKPLPPFS